MFLNLDYSRYPKIYSPHKNPLGFLNENALDHVSALCLRGKGLRSNIPLFNACRILQPQEPFEWPASNQEKLSGIRGGWRYREALYVVGVWIEYRFEPIENVYLQYDIYLHWMVCPIYLYGYFKSPKEWELVFEWIFRDIATHIAILSTNIFTYYM